RRLPLARARERADAAGNRGLSAPTAQPRGGARSREDRRHDRRGVPGQHSLRAPAVGYRIAAGTRTIFYAPDLVAIDEEDEARAGLDLYVGDGAAIARSIVRRDGTRIGHSSIADDGLQVRV
ncbi:MAG TPA: hypothetical protein VGJ77_22605, partial [Gaiellaceae bacterium]